MEEERRRRLSLVKDEEAKEAHEKEVRRQNRLIAVLEEEEARARAFYKFEFDDNLRERRDMKESEQEMRLFMLESKATGGSKYDVGGSSTKKSSKQERRDQLKKEQARKLVRDRECKEMLAEDNLAMSIRTEEKKAEQLAALKKVSDSAQKMNLNLTWSPRRRRRDATPPRRHRCGLMRVYASRERAAAVSRRCRSHTGSTRTWATLLLQGRSWTPCWRIIT